MTIVSSLLRVHPGPRMAKELCCNIPYNIYLENTLYVMLIGIDTTQVPNGIIIYTFPKRKYTIMSCDIQDFLIQN